MCVLMRKGVKLDIYILYLYCIINITMEF
jgi:hypothetical protein